MVSLQSSYWQEEYTPATPVHLLWLLYNPPPTAGGVLLAAFSEHTPTLLLVANAVASSDEETVRPQVASCRL